MAAFASVPAPPCTYRSAHYSCQVLSVASRFEMPRGKSRSENELRERILIAVRPGEDMDVEELVNVLRDVYPEYRRQKLNPFTRCVEEIMNSFTSEVPAEEQSISNDDKA